MEKDLIEKSNSLKIIVSTSFELHEYLNPSISQVYNLLEI